MGELWKIIQTHLDRVGVTEAEFSRRMGSSPQTLNSWKNRGLRQLPEKRLLEAVSEITATSFSSVLSAALIDIGYIQQPFSSARTHHGAWELDHRTLAELSLKGDDLEMHASTAHATDEDDDIEDVVSAAHDLADETVEFISAVNEVLEVGVGGRAHLRILRSRIVSERQDRAKRSKVARSLPNPDKAADSTPADQGSQPDYELAQRKGETEAEWRERTGHDYE